MLLMVLSMAFILADAQPLYEARAVQAAEDFGLVQKGTASYGMDFGSTPTAVALAVPESQVDGMKMGGYCPRIYQTTCQPRTTCQPQTICQPQTTCQQTC